MPLGITRDHVTLTTTLREWAVKIDGPAAARAGESDPEATFATVWPDVVEMGLTSVALPESLGGGGSDVLDQLIASEAAAFGLVPGPILGTALVGLLAARAGATTVVESVVAGDTAAVALGDDLALDVVGARWLLTESDDGLRLLDRDDWRATPSPGLDLTRRGGRVTVDPGAESVALDDVEPRVVSQLVVALCAAEASGVAQWCLQTAVEYAKVREQFGAPIGSFQAVKHLCAGMLETVESIAAVAWDLGTLLSDDAPAEEVDFAADVAAAVAIDGAVSVAHDCIQVLGGIGFTFEHDAHLYLRRALTLRAVASAFTQGTGEATARLAQAAADGRRRVVELDFDGADEPARTTTRETLSARSEVPTEYVMAHLAAPFGVGAGPIEQVVIDAELAAAGLTRPDLKIGGWAIPSIIEHGTDEQRERFVHPTLTGEITWCQLFSEPGAGSDLASLSTKAERVDGGWSLTGQKVWTSLAHEADWAICLARTDREAAKHRGITFFLIDMTSDGLDIRPLREITGDAMFNEVFLDGVFVPDECVVGEVNDGWKVSRTTLSSERVAMAGTKLGLSTERAVALVGRDGSPQLRSRVGAQVALATVCQLVGVRATMRSIAGRGPGPESSVAKLLGVRNRQEASDLVGELLGPRVLLGDDPEVAADLHEQLLTRCLSIAGGTTQVLRNVVAERVLGLPR